MLAQQMHALKIRIKPIGPTGIWHQHHTPAQTQAAVLACQRKAKINALPSTKENGQMMLMAIHAQNQKKMMEQVMVT